MHPAPTVREARPAEHDALGALTVAAYRGLLGPDMDSGYAAELADVATRAAQATVLVAVGDGDRILGGITYIAGPGPLAWFDGPAQAGLRMLAVAPDAQRRGVGAALVAAGVRRAAAEGRASVLLHTTAPMTVAHRLYERAGFRRDPGRDRVLDGGLVLLAYILELRR
jgi:ribosomal protein S18 acetylase RimI-like enzyme